MKRSFRSVPYILMVVVMAVPLAGFTSIQSLFAPKSELWERWTAHDAASTRTIDHAKWDAFLATYLEEDAKGLNRIAYARVSDADKVALRAYIDSLAAVEISGYARPEQYAYWTNLYNALTVQVILDHYPVASIQDIDISPGFLSNGPWGAELVTVEGEKLTLNDIEHRILRPIWRDPRLHYAVNCAAVGCPNLAGKAYTGATMDAMLEDAARAYVNDPRGVQIGQDGLVVSSIYIWFQDDFGGDDAGVIGHLKKYAEPSLAQKLDAAKEIDGHAYDWSLNALGGAS